VTLDIIKQRGPL